MVTRKKSTSDVQTSRPVRFYKFVALTFLIITIVLLGSIIFMSSKRAEIIITTRPEPIEAHFSLSIGDNPETQKVEGFATSTVIEYSKEFNPEGTKEEDGVAEGSVVITNKTNLSQSLVATTRLLTPDDKLFRIKKNVVVPAGGSIEVEAYADKPGVAGNIGPTKFTIPGLNSSKQEFIYAESSAPMRGGVKMVGIVDAEDITKAEQIWLAGVLAEGERVFSELYPELGIVYREVQHTVNVSDDIGVETDSFSLSGKATVFAVLYNKEQLKKYAETMLEKRVVEDSKSLRFVNAEPTVVLADDIDLGRGVATLDVTHTGLVNLDSDSSDLQKLIFFGKTEDEVRRYVMSLDHVQKVEMKFRPVWNRTVSHVGSHVTVKVVETE